MKKTLILILLNLFLINNVNSQSIENEEDLSLEYVELTSVQKDSVSLFQYRISFIEINSKSVANEFKIYIKDSFQSDVTYNETLNMFIFTLDNDMSQGEITKNFPLPLQCNYFKKIDMSKISVSTN